MSTVYIKETYRVLKQFSLREHLLGHQRQLNIVKAKTCPLFVLGSCTLSTNMDELPYPPLDKSEKCPKRVAISHVQKLEM